MNSWLYGRIEVRAKLPKGHGLWPAIWMLPTDNEYGGWPTSGEIDIMEGRGGETGAFIGSLHYGEAWPNNKHTSSGKVGVSCVEDFSAGFHDYAVVWTPSTMVWLLDGVTFHTMRLDGMGFGGLYSAPGQPFDRRFHLVLNLAVGGNFFGSPALASSDVELGAWVNGWVDG